MIGSTLAHYRILSELGAGGMGTVYLAEDTKLGRKVALKVLDARTAADPERLARFEREARAVAGLSHPNIVVLYSVERDGDVAFITMEHVTGKPLSHFIPTGGMATSDVFKIAIPLADAIYGAHKQGIAHRDLKPDNVMIDDDGRVKVLDFGLAKMVEAEFANPDAGATMAVGELVTGEGRILGTPAYMSPEQAESKTVDHRTDIFSLGIMLFEMVTGQRPFKGDTKMSTLTSVLRDQPPAVTELKAGIPNHLGRVVQRCLAKDPDRRYQTALDVRNELETVRDELMTSLGSGISPASGIAAPGPVTPPPGQTPVTPPPVAQQTPTPYPGSSSMLTQPTRPGWIMPVIAILGIAVVGSALFFGLRGGSKDTAPAPRQAIVANNRGADASPTPTPTKDTSKSVVVFPFENLGPPEDAYFAAGITDEITSRLAMVDGLSVISRTSATQYDKTGKTLVQIGEDLGVAYVLEGTVRWEKLDDGGSRVRVAPNLVRCTDDTQIWADRYERSMDEIFRIQSEIADQVVQQLGLTLLEPARLAMTESPTNNLDAYHAYLRGCELMNAASFTRQDQELAAEMMERAVSLDPEFTLAWAMLAKAHSGYLHFNWDRSQERQALARAAVERTEELAPGSGWAHYARGYYLYWGLKDLEPALLSLERARNELPGNADVLEVIGFALRRQGKFAEALQILEQAEGRDPRNLRLLWTVGETYGLLGDYPRQRELGDRVISLSPDIPAGYRLKLWAYASMGMFDEALATHEEMPSHDNAGSDAQAISNYMTLAGRLEEAVEYAEAVPEFQEEQFGLNCRALSLGLAHGFLGQTEDARPWFESARERIGEALVEKPDDSNLLSAMGLAHAGLGNREQAVEAGRRALEVYPATHDVWLRITRSWDLLEIYLLLDLRNEAVDLLTELLDLEAARMTPAMIRVSPIFDKLRDDPRFSRLVEPAS